ncbi:unnamed protein product [Paramecium octaurelia]|uniref:Uncharacterized protein n=1 Tax=Paramecium octaurelia TaxID=43137 RepID=A0A8S1VMF8_PAROT|nr:unnamed protein product [Paramecium octaurelia]
MQYQDPKRSKIQFQFSPIFIFRQFSQLQQGFQSLYQQRISHILNQEFTINSCYKFQLSNCKVCSNEMRQKICIQCEFNYQTIDGVCIRIEIFAHSQTQFRFPDYLNSFKECKLCQVKNCKYCFEYKKDELEKSTLYANFERFRFDEFINIGCAMCEVNYIFDFQIGKCIYKQPSLSICLRTFVNLDGQEICTLEFKRNFYIIISATDFSVALEQLIVESKFKIVYNVQSLLCMKVYYLNQIQKLLKTNTIIYKCKNYILGCLYLNLEFMMKCLPNQYFYQRFEYAQFYFSQEIECNQGDQLSQSQTCLGYCTSECLDCQQNKNVPYFSCATCPLNQYFQPIRSQAEGSCITCAELCQICQIRSEDELQKLNSQFRLTNENKLYSYKCETNFE